jgi:hypothetical protein
MAGHQFFDRIATQWRTADARKHAVALRTQIMPKPRLDDRDRVPSERRAPLLAALALAPHVRAAAHDDVLTA